MKQTSVVKSVLKFAPLALAVSCSLTLLSGCSSSDSATPANATISGTIVAAPVNGADVSVVDVDGLLVAETEKTDAAGKYTDLVIPHGNLAQDLIVKSAGGAFIDEATGNDGIAGEMLAYVSADSLINGSSVSVTPGSTIVADLVMNHGKSLAEAETAFFAGFGYVPDASVTPVDATVVAVDASDESKLAGLRAAAFSQLAKGLGLSQNDQFKMFTALAQDLSNGKLDGQDADGAVVIESTDPAIGSVTLPADIFKRSANALLDFQMSENNEMNLTSSYRIEYEPAMAKAGKSAFTFTIKNRSDGEAVSGLKAMVMPMMYMAAHSHSTPLSDVTDNGDGTYTATIYYLMPSSMEGASMGTWDLAVKVENETVHFYPNVMMAMGDTAMVKLKGVEDKVTDMNGLTVGRTYPIFKQSLMPMGAPGHYQFEVFVAVQESMMSFPAVFDGSLLNGNVIDATVEIDDGTGWRNAMDDGNGIWSLSGMTLTTDADVKDEIRVRLTINDTVYDEMKTTDGKTREVDVNDFQTFTVTPNPSGM
jgi:hypothetical protein